MLATRARIAAQSSRHCDSTVEHNKHANEYSHTGTRTTPNHKSTTTRTHLPCFCRSIPFSPEPHLAIYGIPIDHAYRFGIMNGSAMFLFICCSIASLCAAVIYVICTHLL